MIRKRALAAAILAAAMLMNGCLAEGGPVLPSEQAQTDPATTEAERSMEGVTFPQLPEVNPIPPEWGTLKTSEEPSAENPVTSSIERSAEAPTGEGTDIEGTTETTTTQPTETAGEGTTETTTARSGPQQEGEAEKIALDPSWKYADESRINSGYAVLYRAEKNRKGIVIGVNAGHGTEGGDSVKTYCHPDHTPKVTGGTTAEGSVKAVAVSSGMDFRDGTPERAVTLKTAQYLKTMLLEAGYDVLMLRDGKDVQLDNVARTVICNHAADCHIAIHWDSDGLDYDKGAYFMSVPDDLKDMYPVSDHWRDHETLGRALIAGCRETGYKVWGEENMDMDLTQTSYSTVPSVDIEMGNENSDTDDDVCYAAAAALFAGINIYFSGE